MNHFKDLIKQYVAEAIEELLNEEAGSPLDAIKTATGTKNPRVALVYGSSREKTGDRPKRNPFDNVNVERDAGLAVGKYEAERPQSGKAAFKLASTPQSALRVGTAQQRLNNLSTHFSNKAEDPQAKNFQFPSIAHKTTDQDIKNTEAAANRARQLSNRNNVPGTNFVPPDQRNQQSNLTSTVSDVVKKKNPGQSPIK